MSKILKQVSERVLRIVRGHDLAPLSPPECDFCCGDLILVDRAAGYWRCTVCSTMYYGPQKAKRETASRAGVFNVALVATALSIIVVVGLFYVLAKPLKALALNSVLI